MNIPLSKDPEYLRAEKDKGVLRWDLTLASAEEKATIVIYSYSMTYDNDMNIRPVSGQ